MDSPLYTLRSLVQTRVSRDKILHLLIHRVARSHASRKLLISLCLTTANTVDTIQRIIIDVINICHAQLSTSHTRH